MASEIVRHDVQALVNEWMDAEREGIRFPVPFDTAWTIAGYATKASGKRFLGVMKEGKDFSTQKLKNGQRGRSSQLIHLTCDAFKHMCLMAETPEGEQIRDYFIECERKWKLLQQKNPAIAQEIELENLRNRGRELEFQSKQVDLQLIQFRHYVTTALPEVVQKKIFGYTEIPVIEYRDRIIRNDDVVNDGSTATKTELCKRYGILTRNGKPGFKRLGRILEQMPPESFTLSARIQENHELKREYLPALDKLIDESDRNRWIGE